MWNNLEKQKPGDAGDSWNWAEHSPGLPTLTDSAWAGGIGLHGLRRSLLASYILWCEVTFPPFTVLRLYLVPKDTES